MQFRNKQTVYNGEVYDSVAEVIFAKSLDLRKKAKDIKNWGRQYRIDFEANGIHICSYYCDFIIFHKDKTKELVEIKGYRTDVYKIKRKLLEALFLANKKNKKFRYTVINADKKFYRR